MHLTDFVERGKLRHHQGDLACMEVSIAIGGQAERNAQRFLHSPPFLQAYVSPLYK
jgi:hypothetical protein